MKAVVIYAGESGPAADLAHAMGDELAQLGGSVEVHGFRELQPAMLEQADLVVLGGPTHNGRADRRTRRIVDLLGCMMPMGTFTAAYDTEPVGVTAQGTAGRVGERFRELGYSTLEPAHFRVSGPRDELAVGEIEHARDWIHHIAEGVAA